MNKPKAALYCRLSEEDRNKECETDDSRSIQNQKAMLTQYAVREGWDIYGVYSDDDYTGADRKRPAFNRLLNDAEARRFDIILCKTQSRFTREMELVEKYIHGLFPLWGIRFVSIVDNADTANRGNKKSRQINGLVNEWYLEDMSDNIRDVLTSRRKNGFHIGSFALYGYKKDPEKKGHLIIDAEAAAVVREVFTLFSKGYGKTAIARILNDRAIPNPTEYKRLSGMRYKQPNGKTGTLWKYSAISDMLKNEMYIGNMVQGKYGSVSYKTKTNHSRPRNEWIVVKGTHEPIIDMTLWEKVQATLSEKTKPFGSGTVGVFAGIARCAACGYTLRSSQNRGRRYLSCPNRYIAKDACTGAFISADRLEQTVLHAIRTFNEKYLDREMLLENAQLRDESDTEKTRLRADADRYEKKIRENESVLQKLYLDRVNGIVREEDFLLLSHNFAEEKSRFEKLAAGSKEALEHLEAATAVRDFDAEIETRLNVSKLDRETVLRLIDHISVGRRIAGTRNVPITICWNF